MNSEIIERVKENLKDGLEQIDQIAIRNNIEIWKSVNGFPNYAVSSKGNVKNVVTKRILKPTLNSRGYFTVDLCKNGMRKNHKVHRLVALTYIPNPDNKPCVDHKNNIKTDNNATNLRFATHNENGMNQSLSSKNTTKVKGVYWHKQAKKWHSQITINLKLIHIGLYTTLEEAKEARKNKANELFGEFINTCEAY